jgi:hypothetical protein
MDDVFNTEQPEQEENQHEESQQVEQATEQSEANAETTAAATNTEKHVPLAALEAERRGRQDWKERATRAEERARMLEEQQQARAAQGGQQQPVDPIQQLHQVVLNERFNTSEMIARQKYADLDDVVALFQEARQQNPALDVALHQHPNPYEFAYREGKRMQLLKEVGDDPAAYRAKVEAEIRAELQKTAPGALNLPSSLAGARSTGPRSAPAFTGPAPLSSLFNN